MQLAGWPVRQGRHSRRAASAAGTRRVQAAPSAGRQAGSTPPTAVFSSSAMAVTALLPRMVPRMVWGRRNFQNASLKATIFCAADFSGSCRGGGAGQAVGGGASVSAE